MKRRAIVKARRTDRHTGPMVFLVCPYCGRTHWVPAAEIGRCPRRAGQPPFVITDR
jgi:hypothetical protein